MLDRSSTCIGLVSIHLLLLYTGILFVPQVLYRTDFFTTVQDYMKKDPINVWVYDRIHKKRRQVTLRVPSETREKRKTQVSTFVNFIHQKDAYIAMNVILEMLNQGSPIYTVHDNFITTADHSKKLPDTYVNIFCKMDPLSIINEYIYHNVIDYQEK
uniref:hypothetical protein n=1 Tax=Helianthus occidentalis TaxID=73303 RepID=UPI001D101CC5|nr:hypothetical protein LK184_mgp09 [Helianthus occidentalis]YP_010191862.1 hypothetical protein LK292_mgp29 [Helianthus tuberosus]QZL38876.1 hypothetical protein [Helianthus occidentalis]QZL38906.1 hypothetical protein [Helianthus tuberosus]